LSPTSSTKPVDNPDFSGFTEEEKAGLLDAIKRFGEGDPSALNDIMKYTGKIPKGMFVYGQGSGGVGFGINGAQVKLDFLSAGLKIKKNHDGSVEIELAGQLGVKPGAEVAVGASGGGGLRAGTYVKISEDGQKVAFGSKIGAGASGEGTAKTPGAGVFGKLGVDVSAMGGWEIEMSAERYANLTPFEKQWLSNPAYAAYLAKKYEDVGLYITMQAGGSVGGSGGGHGGAGWGPQGGVEVGVGWESEGYNIVPNGWDRIHLLWYWQHGERSPHLIIFVTVHYDQPEVTT